MSQESSTSPPDQSFWRSVAQALRGEEHDYTALPLNRAVILLAVVTAGEMLVLFKLRRIFASALPAIRVARRRIAVGQARGDLGFTLAASAAGDDPLQADLEVAIVRRGGAAAARVQAGLDKWHKPAGR